MLSRPVFCDNPIQRKHDVHEDNLEIVDMHALPANYRR
jgi:hypothetical protein